MPIGPTGSRYRRIPGNWQRAGAQTSRTLTTALTGTNNDLKYTAAVAGTTGTAPSVEYTAGGPLNRALAVVVTGSAIRVDPATDGAGAITSTAAQVRTAVNGSAPAAALVTAANADGNDGTGVVTVLAPTSLSGGTDYVIGRGR